MFSTYVALLTVQFGSPFDDRAIFQSPLTQRDAMAISIPMVPYASNKGIGAKKNKPYMSSFLLTGQDARRDQEIQATYAYYGFPPVQPQRNGAGMGQTTTISVISLRAP